MSHFFEDQARCSDPSDDENVDDDVGSLSGFIVPDGDPLRSGSSDDGSGDDDPGDRSVHHSLLLFGFFSQ